MKTVKKDKLEYLVFEKYARNKTLFFYQIWWSI